MVAPEWVVQRFSTRTLPESKVLPIAPMGSPPSAAHTTPWPRPRPSRGLWPEARWSEGAAPPSRPCRTGTAAPELKHSDDPPHAPWFASATPGPSVYPQPQPSGIPADPFSRSPYDRPAFQPYWGNPAVRNERGIEETSASFEARSAPRSYPTIEGWPRWAALYDLESIEALNSPAYRAVSGPNSTPWSKRILPRTIGRMRVLAEQVAPGDALTRPQGEVGRLLVVKYACLAGSASIVDALTSAAQRYKGTLQLRVFRSHFEAANDTWAIVEFDRPLDAVSLHPAFSEVAGVSARMLNLYAPYFRG